MAKKDFGKRLIPEYLLKYSEDLFKNHPDPSASWGGGSEGGGDYTAGYGIKIDNKDISIDQDVVALKSALNGYIENNDTSYSAVFRGKGVYVREEGGYNSTSYGDGSIHKSVQYQPGYTYTFPEKSGTFAMKDDIITSYNDLNDKPTIPTVNDPTITFLQGTAVKGTIHLNQSEDSTIVFEEGGVSSVAWNDITDKPTFSDVATSGSYNDLKDKPTIPDGTTNPFLRITDANDTVFFSLTGAAQTFYKSLDLKGQPPVHVNLRALNPVFGTGLTSTYDTSSNQLKVAVDTSVVALKSDIPDVPSTDNLVTTDTAQTITGLKTIGETSGTTSEVDFSGFTFKLSNKAINHPEADIKIRNGSYDGYQHPIISSSKGLYVNLAKIRLGDDGNNTYGITMPDSSTWESDRVLATTADIPTVPTTATSTSTSTSTVTPTTETLVFTLADDSTVTVTVMTGATVSTETTTTTTLS